MKKGKLIVIEGACDGIGKSTQYNLLCKKLKEEGYEVVNHHFPSYGTPQAKMVEKYLKGELGKPSELSPYYVTKLYSNDRKVTWEEELKKSYDEGKIILLDRYTTSSLIYQSALIEDIKEKKEFISWVNNYEYEELGIKKPDNVIFLYAPFDLVSELRSKRKENDGVSNDIHERDIEFMKKVYENAMFVADYLSWNKIKCNEEDKMRSIEDIHNEIYTSLNISKIRKK